MIGLNEVACRGVKGGLLPSAYTSGSILSAVLVFISELLFAQTSAPGSIMPRIRMLYDALYLR